MKLKLNQQQSELAYSLFLVVLIPACMIGLTLWLTSQVKQNFDQELRRKANLANEVFSVSVQNALTANNPQQAAVVIQSLIDQTRPQAPEISQLSVAVPEDDGFQTIASSDRSRVNQPDNSTRTQLAWSHTQSVATIIASGEGQSREWMVATPIVGPAGTPIAITSVRVSLSDADKVMSATLRNAFIILAIMLVVIMLLLLNHFRFVQYAELFRKQKELDQMKDDFISVATHELKAPMSIIKGYISMALEESTLSKSVRDMLTIGFNQTDRLAHLVGDLLDVSRLEQGRTKFNLQPVDLPGLIKPMLAVFEVKAKDKGLQLSYQPPADLPPALADPNRVSEIFTNLIDNAIKYSRTGTVTVTHTVGQGTVTTTVADTGIGMTPDEQSRLFQRFYRAQNADTADIAGTGLGLWIIKQYAEKMGGTIRVESEKGKGSRFIVVLPTPAPSASPPSAAPHSPTPTAPPPDTHTPPGAATAG